MGKTRRRPEQQGTRPTGFEPVTFGFVARACGSAGLRGARFQAVFGGPSPAGIGWNLWGMLPHLLPQGPSLGLGENPAFHKDVKEECGRDAAPIIGLLPSIEDQIYGDVEPSKRSSEPGGLCHAAVEVGLDDDQVQLLSPRPCPAHGPKRTTSEPGATSDRRRVAFDQGLIRTGARRRGPSSATGRPRLVISSRSPHSIGGRSRPGSAAAPHSNPLTHVRKLAGDAA